MAEFVVMPKLGFDMREGVLVRLLKQVGESVSQGDIVAEIESDKATLELESQVGGTLLKWLAAEGDSVPVGANLAIVGAAGEDVSALAGGVTPVAPLPTATTAPLSASVEVSPAPPAAVSAEFPAGVKATPVARRLARENQLDLTQLSGSSPGGRVRKADIENYLQTRPAIAPTQPAPAPVTASAPGAEVTEIPASRLRQIIARRMTESKTTVPHFYVTSAIHMEAALAVRQQVNAVLPDDEKVSVNDLIVKAAALALRDFPNLNASFGGDRILRHNQINVGSAVAVEGGLLTVVQKNSDRSSLRQIARDNRAMITRARAGKVQPDDISGSTFSVSNLGPFDVEHFVAIINPPEAAILAVGSVLKVPMVVGDAIVISQRMQATVSADHRVTDGAEVARFLQALKGYLETPIHLLL